MLELSGVERGITWDVEAGRQGDVISALATTNFLYEDFDIPVLNIGGFVSVEEDVHPADPAHCRGRRLTTGGPRK